MNAQAVEAHANKRGVMTVSIVIYTKTWNTHLCASKLLNCCADGRLCGTEIVCLCYNLIWRLLDYKRKLHWCQVCAEQYLCQLLARTPSILTLSHSLPPPKQVQAECVEEVRAAVAMLTRNSTMLAPVNKIVMLARAVFQLP